MKNSVITLLLLITIFGCKTNQKIETAVDAKQKFISFYKGGCYGTCPIYKITINGDGSFIYFGKANVEHLGNYKGVISEEIYKQLFTDLEKYKWQKYPDEFPIDNVDFPQFSIEYSNGKVGKKIQANYNAASEIVDLANRIDAITKDLSFEKLN